MNGADRPDPDALLARVREEDRDARRGRLKVFLGGSPGVGKTFAMLTVARDRHAQGLPLLVGFVETHGRAETEALLDGLEVLPRRTFEYRGVVLSEFDLDATLERSPPLVLVDEFAHTNAPGSRHAKRWQDVDELLAAGIDVWTTLNVQHLESLNDIVTQITGVRVRETLPDSALERADEIELVDLPPDELLERLRAGKVYAPDLAGPAREAFFRKGNLIALRELAMRAAAERVDAQMQVWRRAEAKERSWAVTERVLVSISSSPSATQIVRAGRRMATRLRAHWIVVWVDTPRQQALPQRDRDYAAEALRLAETLGAEAVTLDGQDPAAELVAYARRRNVTRIVVGKPGRFWWRDRITGSFIDKLIGSSAEIDILVVAGDREGQPAASPGIPVRRRRVMPYLWATVAVLLATAVTAALHGHLESSNLIMVFLLAVAATATFWGRGPAVLAAVLGVAAFDFFLVEPIHTFAVADTRFVITFLVMLVIGLLIGTLSARNREQAEAARRREQETVALYSLSRDLAANRGTVPLSGVAARHVSELFGLPVAVFLPGPSGVLAAVVGAEFPFAQDADEQAVASWVYRHNQRAGWGTDTLPGAKALHVPLSVARGTLGTLAIAARPLWRSLPSDQLHLLEAFANQMALALERERLAEDAEQSRLRIEAERLQSALLSSVSHDLRTPLASISGAATVLADDTLQVDATTRRELAETVVDEADRMSRLVGNLLDMTRLTAGVVHVRREAHAIDELIGAAIERIGSRRLEGRRLHLDVPADLPLVPVDGVLIEQVIVNILDNALRYTPAGSPLDIVARHAGDELWLMIADRGPGFAPGEETLVFERFARGSAGSTAAGTGLGLAICRGILDAHGGRISAANRSGGGAVFRIGLPLNPVEDVAT